MRPSTAIPMFSWLLLVGCKADKHETWTTDTADTAASTEDADGDGYTPADGDCDDADASVHPGAEEVACDGIDQDCDGADGGDEDGDGVPGSACGGDDCDDSDASIYPGAEEVACDGIDQDCDGVDLSDVDGDGYDAEACGGDDCDDSDASIYPGAPDTCHDGVDSDCVGNDDDDCDRDGYIDAAYGGDDCDDDDHTINPGAAEVCQDGIDNDCDESTTDCDCDGDGYEGEPTDAAPECSGEDCDDEDPSVNPAGSEAEADGLDSDCDGEVDEDAYCNPYFPTSNGSTAMREYQTQLFDGNTYDEYDTIASWDPTTGLMMLRLDLSSSAGSYSAELNYTCDGGEISLAGWDLTSSGSPLWSLTFSDPRVDLPPESDLVAGTTWSADYVATDASMGDLYHVIADFSVVGDDTITVTAGTFDVVVIEADYEVIDLSLGMFAREGTATYHYAPRLGLVYSEDIQADGSVYDRRELVAYSGFYP